MKTSIVAIAILALLGYSAADTPAGNPSSDQPRSLEDLSWLAGQWSGRLFGQPCEEHWMKPEGSSMVGMFRLGPAGKKPVYEIMLIEQEADAVMLRIRHFGARLVPWEKDEPVTLRLARLADREAVFEPAGATDLKKLTYRMQADGTLFVELQLDRSGQVTTESSTLQRRPAD